MSMIDRLRTHVGFPKKTQKKEEKETPLPLLKQNYLEKLPSDLINQIFMYCGPKDTLQTCATSQALRGIKDKCDYYLKNIEPLKFSGPTGQCFKMYGEPKFYQVNVNTSADGLKGIHLKRLLKLQNDNLPYAPNSMRIYYNTKEITDEADVKPFKIINSNHCYIKID
jgi:hypothetical protein